GCAAYFIGLFRKNGWQMLHVNNLVDNMSGISAPRQHDVGRFDVEVIVLSTDELQQEEYGIVLDGKLKLITGNARSFFTVAEPFLNQFPFVRFKKIPFFYGIIKVS